MPDNVLLFVILLAPILLLTLLRVNAVMAFLSLCLGDVMVHYVAGDANSLLTFFSPHLSAQAASSLQLITLAAPVILTSIFMAFTIKGQVRTLLNILPAAGGGLVGVLLAVPLLPSGIRFAIENQSLWTQLSRLQSLIVGVSAIISLFFLWMQRKRLHSEE